MPIYEYQCRHCGHQLEVIQKMDEPALSECPKCQQAALEKKISAAGFQLKGTGWYVTDFKGSGGAASNSSDTHSEDAAQSKAPEKASKSGSQET